MGLLFFENWKVSFVTGVMQWRPPLWLPMGRDVQDALVDPICGCGCGADCLIPAGSTQTKETVGAQRARPPQPGAPARGRHRQRLSQHSHPGTPHLWVTQAKWGGGGVRYWRCWWWSSKVLVMLYLCLLKYRKHQRDFVCGFGESTQNRWSS